MKISPSPEFSEHLTDDTRVVTYDVTISIDGTPTNVKENVNNIAIRRTAGDAKAIATFTAALASEIDVVLTPSSFNLGTNPVGSSITIDAGFNGEHVKMFTGRIQRVRRSAISGTTTITCLDNALSLTRIGIQTPGLIDVNSALYIKEILENAGVSSRVAGPDVMLFALDFDSHEICAITSARKDVSDTDDNGINQTLMYPHRWYGFSGKPYTFKDDGRSGRLVVESFQMTHADDQPNVPTSMQADMTRIMPASNAASRQYIATPGGYGGGSIMNPKVLHFPGSKFGYPYWMVVQPRPKTALSKEDINLWMANGYLGAYAEAMAQGSLGDPCVLVSDNGTTWGAPSFSNPLATVPVYTVATPVWIRDATTRRSIPHTMQIGEDIVGVFNCEPTLYYDGTNIVLIWRQVYQRTDFWYYRTFNGSTWSPETLWLQGTRGAFSSPTVCKDQDGILHAWWIDKGSNPNLLKHTTIASIGSPFNSVDTCTIDAEDIWRLDVINDHSGKGFNACITLCSRNSVMEQHRIVAGSSIDGIDWQVSRQLISPVPLGWDSAGAQSGCFVENVDDATGQLWDMWYVGRNNTFSYGLGKTDVFQSMVSYIGVTPLLRPFGPVYYGPASFTKTIDGVHDAMADVLWPRSAADTASHKVSIGGWFAFTSTINWTDGCNVLFMESDWGTNTKLILYAQNDVLACTLRMYEGGVWVSKAYASHTLTGTWQADEEHFITATLEVQWGVTDPKSKIHLNLDGTHYDGSFTEDASLLHLEGLSGVTIITSMSSDIHASIGLSHLFPGMTFDNLFVCIGEVTAPPVAMYQLDRGLNRLAAAAYRGTNPWEELKLVAESELGCMAYDEDGIFHFFNRQHFTHPDNSGIVGTIDKDSQLKSCSVSQDIGDIRNVVRVKVKDIELGIARDIWSLDTPWIIRSEETLTYEIQVAGVLESCDTIVNSIIRYGGTRYRAAIVTGYDNGNPVVPSNGAEESLGGAEDYLEITIVPYGRVISVTVHNNHPTQDVALVDGNGTSYFYIWGRIFNEARFKSGESRIVEVSDSESISLYGANEVEINMEYITTVTEAESLARYALQRYKNGIQKLEDIVIIGNPLIEVGDRFTVVYPPLGINGSYWIERIDDNFGPDRGYEQKIDLSISDEGNWFILGESTLSGSDVLTY